MPNNSLALRPPNHHLCLTHLALLGPNHLASGTKSGTIRTYDTRQRKPVQEWKAAREGGVGSIAQGASEQYVPEPRAPKTAADDAAKCTLATGPTSLEHWTCGTDD